MKTLFTALLLALPLCQGVAQVLTSDNKMARPFNQVMSDIEHAFGVRFKYNVDTAGLVVTYAPSRIKPYSLDETLQNVLAPFDFKAWLQADGRYKIKPYEYYRHYDADGQKMTDYLNTLYHNREEWEARAQALRQAVRQTLGIDSLLPRLVALRHILSRVRHYDGYTVQNIALELLPGYYVCGSVYAPANRLARRQSANQRGQYPVIISPNGHWADGRYNRDLQIRYATLARMGTVCISFDLFGWGESELQVGRQAHESSLAQVWQVVSAIRLLDYALTRRDADPLRIGSCGGSGGGTHAVLLATVDSRINACCPVAHVASHFDGGCPCESGMPVQYVCGGTTTVEMLATMAPRPIMLVGDGKDWTHTHPTIEVPYLKRIYGFYQASDSVRNVFLPDEGHDFGPNKRKAVYDYFASVWNLPLQNADEAKVSAESKDLLFSFGAKTDEDGTTKPSGANAPDGFERSILHLKEYVR